MFNLVLDDSHSLTHSQVPVDIFGKEGVSLDLLSSIRTKPSCWITLEKPSHDALCFPRYVVREYKWVHEDPLVHRVHVFIIERWETSLEIDEHVSRRFQRQRVLTIISYKRTPSVHQSTVLV